MKTITVENLLKYLSRENRIALTENIMGNIPNDPAPNSKVLVNRIAKNHAYKLWAVFNEYGTINGLELIITLPTDDEVDDNLVELEDNCFVIANCLKNILQGLFSDYTNNDACSYQATFDSDHAAIDNGKWSILVTVTDYLS